jgi:IS5 family transposase
MQLRANLGQGKRRFGLNLVMAKLDNTSQTAIAITFLVMNLSTWWRRVFCVFLCRSEKTMPVFGSKHNLHLCFTQIEAGKAHL